MNRNIQEQIFMLLDKRIELTSRYPALEEGNYSNIPEEIIGGFWQLNDEIEGLVEKL